MAVRQCLEQLTDPAQQKTALEQLLADMPRYQAAVTANPKAAGPLIEARAGDTVRLRFKNELPEATNLHYHGLHVPPTGNADNSFDRSPGHGEQQQGCQKIFTAPFKLTGEQPGRGGEDEDCS